MFKWFLPRETSFFDFFETHASLTVQAAKELLSLMMQGTDAVVAANRIRDLEHEADKVTHQCVEALRKTFITPFERDDIYRLISRMDDIIDYIEETSARMVIYRLKTIKVEGKVLAEILVKCTQFLEQAIKGLRHMKDIEEIRTVFKTLFGLENQADIIVREAIGRLFDEEQDIRALIKWKEIFDNIEDAIDRCEDVSNIIEGVILEYD
jgi:predicted phosphate transport protein (TIGR00153 family)